MTQNSFSDGNSPANEGQGTAPTTQPAANSTAGTGDAASTQGFNVEVIEKRLADKDEYITDLKAQLAQAQSYSAELKEANASASNINDLIAKMEEGQGNANQTDTAQTDSSLVDKLPDMVKATLSQMESEKSATSNWVKSEGLAKQAYGDAYLSKVREKAESLGMTIEQVDGLAQTSPQAFSNLFLPKEGNREPEINQGTINTLGMKPMEAPKQVKNVLYGASTKDLVDVWNSFDPTLQ